VCYTQNRTSVCSRVLPGHVLELILVPNAQRLKRKKCTLPPPIFGQNSKNAQMHEISVHVCARVYGLVQSGCVFFRFPF